MLFCFALRNTSYIALHNIIYVVIFGSLCILNKLCQSLGLPVTLFFLIGIQWYSIFGDKFYIVKETEVQ